MNINNNIIESLLNIIECFSDKKFQKRTWVRGEGPGGADFEETVCLFYDLSDPVLENYKEFEITLNQYQALIDFKNRFESFPNRFSLPQEFINTSEWKEIMDQANNVLKAFDYQKRGE